MKKFNVLFALALGCATVFSFTGLYANSGKKAPSPRSKAMMVVHQTFPQVQSVAWSVVGKDQVAIFKTEDRQIKCIFNEKGNLISTLITTCNTLYLPFELKTSLNKRYPGFVPQTISEFIGSQEHAFYVLLKSSQGNSIKWLRVKADEDGTTMVVLQQLEQNV